MATLDRARRLAIDPTQCRAAGVVVVQYGDTPVHPETAAQLRMEQERGQVGAVVVVRSPRQLADFAVPSPIDWAELVVMERNRGYGAAVNKGLSHPALGGAPCAIVITGDVRLAPTCLETLVRALSSEPRLGIVGPLLHSDDGRVTAGGTWTAGRGARHRSAFARGPLAPSSTPRANESVTEVDWVDGAVIGIRRELIDELGVDGPFDAETFLYGEDVQLAVLARRHGWRIGVVAEAVAYQRTGLGRRPGAHGYLIVRNELRTAAASGKAGAKMAAIGAGLGRAGWELSKGAVNRRGMGRAHHLRQALGMLWGVADGIRGVGGPPPTRLADWGDIAGTAPFPESGRTTGRIVQLVTQLDTGGAQSHVAQLALGLGDGFEMLVAAGVGGATADALAEDGVRVHLIDGLSRAIARGNIRAVRSTLAFLREVEPQVLVCHSSKAGAVGRLAAWRLGLPCVYVVHGWPFRYGPISNRLASVTLEWTFGRFLPASVVCVSQSDARWARRTGAVPARRLAVIHHGTPDCELAQLSRPGEHETPHLVMVARPSDQKDHALALRALAECKYQPWRATFIGDGPRFEELTQMVTELGLSDRVALVGEVHDVADRLATADVAMLISKSEGLPISILEAMRAGLPVIASDVGGVSELVTTATGWLVPRGDLEALVDALTAALATPGEQARRGAAARRMWETQFEETVALAAWRDLLNGLASR